MRKPRIGRLSVVLSLLVLVGCAGGGYDRDNWVESLVDGYGISRTSANCILDGVEANGLQDRFAEDSVEIDFEVERVIRACDLPVVERVRLGVGL